jgi:hypothetical protein
MAEPMTPEQVPADLVELGVEASDDYTDRAEQWTSGDHVRAILAAVLPAYREMVNDEWRRKLGMHPDQIRERLAAPARPDSREEILARLLPDVAPIVLREAADAYDAHLMAGGDPNIPCMWLRNRANQIEAAASDAAHTRKDT